MNRTLKRSQIPRKGIQYIIDPQTRAELNPFVFFDAGTMKRDDDGLFIGMHPHSGIGIITYFEGGHLMHHDSAAKDQYIQDGGAQWIQAGGGVWHQEHYVKKDETTEQTWPLTLHQLWLQLPPEWEESEAEYQNFQPETLPQNEQVKVIVGSFAGMESPLKPPFEMTYLDVRLKAGESINIASPKDQTRGFVFPRRGTLKLFDDLIVLNELSILSENEGQMQFFAHTDSEFVLLMAEPQETAIISRGGSIHTNEQAMRNSLQRIQTIRPSE